MPTWFFAVIGVCLVALATLPLTVVFDIARGRRLRAALAYELERTGLTARVAWMEPSHLGGTYGTRTAELVLESSRPLPGKISIPEVPDPDGTWIGLTAPGPDLLVCSRVLTDQIVGPVPALPRLPSGDAAFDSTFDVFATTPSFEAGWLGSKVLRDALVQLDAQWIRRKDGRLEMFLAPIGANQARAALDLGVAIDSHSAPPTLLVPASRRGEFLPMHACWPIVFGTLFALLCAILGASLLWLSHSVAEALTFIACRDGDALVYTGDGDDIGLSCVAADSARYPVQRSLYVACAVLAASVPLGFGALFAWRRLVGAVRRGVPTRREAGSR